MSRKSRERFKDRQKGEKSTEIDPADLKSRPTLEELKRRRTKRFVFVGVIALLFPIFELIAYQYRAITVSFVNRAGQSIRSIKVTYDGGEFELNDIKPEDVASRVIRPNFKFTSKEFSTYRMTIRMALENGNRMNQMGRVGALDFSATELYLVEATPPAGNVQLKHDTRPGFPLSIFRDLLERLGIK